MDSSVVVSSFALLFLAEMGDKTQLMAMTLAHRYRAGPVIAGAFSAFALLNLLAVAVGDALFRYVPQRPSRCSTCWR
jgi:putative Ca2+/H+ antiporter (TMEM165/GDT1 family)